MRGRGDVKRSRLKVGVLILVALSAVAMLALLISGNTGALFGGKFEVRAYFKNASGLKIGSPVKLDGVTIGNVRAIRIVEHPARTPVEAVMSIRESYRSGLRTDSLANLSTIGVLGSTEVDIDNVHAHGPPVKNNGVLETGGIPNLEDALQSFQNTNQKISTTLSEVNLLMKHLDTNEGSIGKLINDPTLRTHAASAVKEFSSIPTQVSAGEGTVGKFMTDPSLMNHVKDMQAKFSDISTAVKDGQGTAGKFIQNPSLGRNLKEASKQLQQISTEVRSGNGAVTMMLKNQEFKTKLHDTGSQLRAVKAQVSAGKGTLGQMKKNSSLDHHLDELVGSSKKLVTGFRKHPLKYVKIRFRIF